MLCPAATKTQRLVAHFVVLRRSNGIAERVAGIAAGRAVTGSWTKGPAGACGFQEDKVLGAVQVCWD